MSATNQPESELMLHALMLHRVRINVGGKGEGGGGGGGGVEKKTNTVVQTVRGGRGGFKFQKGLAARFLVP